MDRLTFIQHIKNPLSKTFHADGTVDSYPPAKLLNSVEKEVEFTQEGLVEKHRLLTLFAKKGFALMKGPLTQILNSESRAGKSDRDAKTRTVVFDFDDITLTGVDVPKTFDSDSLRRITEYVVQKLPGCFHDASYIAHASSSMGTKKHKTVSLHLEFWTVEEIIPAKLKDYLFWLNFDLPFFSEQIKLSASGGALSYRLDPCLADNSRVIFIAPPKFEKKKQNPFKKDADRILLVQKQTPTVNLTTQLLQAQPEKVKQLVEKRLREQYELETGSKWVKPKTKSITLASGRVQLQTNPRRLHMSMYADHGDYCSFNVGTGDSHGYLVNKQEPLIVRNLKGEPNFLFQEADPDTYDWFVNEYLEAEKSEKKSSTGNTDPRVIPYAYISREQDSLKYGWYAKETNELIDILPTRMKTELENWFSQNGALMPEQLPYHSERFDPTDKRTVDLDNNFINTFRPSPIFGTTAELPEGAKGADMNSIQKMKLVAPTIYDLLQHVTCGGEEFPYFVNWLAGVFQKKDKMRTAWVLHGVQGTGKGSLIDGILRPIFQKAARSMNLSVLTEKYNQWLAESLLVMVDEFKSADAMNSDHLNNTIKEYISEPYVPIRAMQRNHSEPRNFANFIFCSNQHDAVYIEDSDRRFNVCRRQEITIMQRYPDWKKRVEKDIPKELELFCAFMQDFKVDMGAACTALENEAKENMRENSRRSQETFANALREGDLLYFAEILNIDPQISNHSEVNTAKNYVKAWVRDYKEGDETKIFNGELRAVYAALIGFTGSEEKFGKLMRHYGIIGTRFRRDKKPGRGIRVKWKINDIERQQLIDYHQITAFCTMGLTEHKNSEKKDLPS